MDETNFKTPFRIKKEAKELIIYNERKELMSQPGAMATAVDKYLTQKYEFGSETTIWFICKRVEKRIKSGEIQ